MPPEAALSVVLGLRSDALQRFDKCLGIAIVNSDLCGTAVQLGRNDSVGVRRVADCSEVTPDSADDWWLYSAHRRLHELTAPAQLCD